MGSKRMSDYERTSSLIRVSGAPPMKDIWLMFQATNVERIPAEDEWGKKVNV